MTLPEGVGQLQGVRQKNANTTQIPKLFVKCFRFSPLWQGGRRGVFASISKGKRTTGRIRYV